MSENPNPVKHQYWEPDKWHEKAEEFYSEVYAGGKCKYCGMAIPNAMTVCECPMMKIARDKFKRDIGALPPAKEYNPNAYTEPEENEKIF